MESPPSDTPIVLNQPPRVAYRSDGVLPTSEILPSQPVVHPREHLPPACAFPQVGEHLADYTLAGRLGGGGMGTVFLGRHRTLGVERAVKVMLMGGQDLARKKERFAREARSLARIRHPSVVSIHEYGVAPQRAGLAYCVLDLVEGGDLGQLLDGGRLPIERVLEVGAEVARALEHIHAAGIVHRDLKPANILVRDGDGKTMLTDFGLARDEVEERMTATGQVMGTLNYMAPEQVQGLQSLIGPATDVYALGIVLHEMLTGELCHPGHGAEVMMEIVHRELESPLGLRPETPSQLDHLVRRCAAKDPSARPTAAAVAEALERIAEGGPGLAPLPWSRVLRRPRVALALALTILITGLVALGLRSDPPDVSSREAWILTAREELVDPQAPSLEPLQEQRAELDQVLATEPDDPSALLATRGRVLLLEGEHALRRDQPSRARDHLQEVEELLAGAALRSDHWLVLDREADSLRGGLSLETKPHEALERLERARALRRERGWAPRGDLERWFVQACLATDQPARALPLVAGEARALLGDDLCLQVLLGADALTANRLRETGLSPPAVAERLYGLGEQDLGRGDVAAATSHLTHAVRLGPASKTRLRLATRARETVERVSRWTERDVDLLLDEAYQEALAHRLLRVLSPTHRVPPTRLDAVRILLGRSDIGPVHLPRLTTLCLTVLEVNPDYIPAYQVLAVGLKTAEPVRRQKLHANIRSAIEATVDTEEGRRLTYFYATSLVSNKDQDGLAELTRLTERGGDTNLTSELIVFQALLELGYDRYPQCLELLEQALRVEPQALQPLLVRSFCHRRMKDQAAALADARAFVRRCQGVDLGLSLVTREFFLRTRLPQWLSAEEQKRRNYAAAARAITPLLQVVSSEVVWAVRRLRLLCLVKPADQELITQGLDDLARRLPLGVEAERDQVKRGHLTRFRVDPLRADASRGDLEALQIRLQELEENLLR